MAASVSVSPASSLIPSVSATREEAPNHDRLIYPVYDNHRLFVFYACNKCEKEQRSKYDPVIFNDYKAYEQKVLENGESFD